MKRNLRLFLLMLLVGTSGLMYSCKDDKMESITLKRIGNAKITVKNGETLLGNTELKLVNADTGGELQVLTTDESGIVSLTGVIEGNYGILMEINSPKYATVYQEFQIVSGENRDITINVSEHSGSLTVYLVDEDKEELIKSELNIGIAVIPRSIEYEKALSAEEKIALATEIKYFGTSGEITFENIPSGTYDLYKIKADTIERNLFETITIERLEEEFFQYEVDYTYEKIFSEPTLNVTSAYDYDDEVVVADFPISSFSFYHTSDGDMLRIDLDNGVFFTMGFEIYNDGEFYFYSTSSSNNDYELYTNEDLFRINDAGKFEFDFDSIEIYDYSETGTHKYFYDITVTLEK